MPMPAKPSKCSLHIKLGRIPKPVTKMFIAKNDAHLERWKSIEITESHCEHESILQHALDAEKKKKNPTLFLLSMAYYVNLWALQSVDFTKLPTSWVSLDKSTPMEKWYLAKWRSKTFQNIGFFGLKTHDRQTSFASANFTGILNTLGISKHHNSSDWTRWCDILWVFYNVNSLCEQPLFFFIFLCDSSWSARFKHH